MRVLHIVAGLPPGGGISESVPSLCRHLRRLGHEVTIATLDGTVSEAVLAAEEAGVRLVRFRANRPHALFFSWQMLRQLRAVCAAADVVHVHSLWTFPVWWGCRCALRVNKPLVISPRGCLDPVRLAHSAWKKRLAGWLDRRCLRRADAVHVTSEAEREWARAYLAAYDAEIAVIPNGVDIEDFSRKGAKTQSDIGSLNSGTSDVRRDGTFEPLRTRTVLYLGRLHPLKGLDLLVEAWSRVMRSSLVNECVSALVADGRKSGDGVRETGQWQSAVAVGSSQGTRKGTKELMNSRTNGLASWQLVIAGPDEQRTKEQLCDNMDTLGLRFKDVDKVGNVEAYMSAKAADVLFLGAVHGEGKWDLLRRADVFVLPSRSENFGIVVGEALACEVPVVMTDVGPWREESARHPVLDAKCCESWSQNGAIRFVETRAESIATGLTDMMRLSDEERGMRGACGREWVHATFSWDTGAKQMLDLYEELFVQRNTGVARSQVRGR